MTILLKNGHIYERGRFNKKDILLNDGVVVSVSSELSESGCDIVYELNNCHLFPGFADVHTHLREPGFSYKETIRSGTMAAARGGYTLICAMPNLNPVPDSPEALSIENKLIDETAVIKVLPYASITRGEKGTEITDFENLAGNAVAFSDDGRGVQGKEIMKAAMLKARKLDKIIAAHCEDDSLLGGSMIHDGEYAKIHGIRGISSESEWTQVKRDLELVRETKCHYHICHVSTKESVELIRLAKAEGLPVSCETAPHYLILSDADLQDDGRFKMNPPLRSKEDRAALIEGILDGTIDMIATDHAPHSAEEKSGGLEKSLMGVVGLETAFPVLYTKLVMPGTVTLSRLIELMSVKPREVFGLEGGRIEEGNKADIAAFDLNRKCVINPRDFLSKGRATPFEGMEVFGESIMTIYNGKVIWRK